MGYLPLTHDGFPVKGFDDFPEFSIIHFHMARRLISTPIDSANLFGLKVILPGQMEFVDWITDPTRDLGSPVTIGYLNAHTVNLACRHDEIGLAIAALDFLYPDGMSVVKMARNAGYPKAERISAADFFEKFCFASAAKGRRLAFIGGPEGLSRQCADAMKVIVPNLKIPICHHGFLKQNKFEDLGKKLCRESCNIVLLGMGTPHQERIARYLADQNVASVVWCVGALFEYFTPGYRRHAPLWMREAGFEWLFRLSQEPGRLAKRYLIGNPEFLLRSKGLLKNSISPAENENLTIPEKG